MWKLDDTIARMQRIINLKIKKNVHTELSRIAEKHTV